jgi:hypothetical protein
MVLTLAEFRGGSLAVLLLAQRALKDRPGRHLISYVVEFLIREVYSFPT